MIQTKFRSERAKYWKLLTRGSCGGKQKRRMGARAVSRTLLVQPYDSESQALSCAVSRLRNIGP